MHKMLTFIIPVENHITSDKLFLDTSLVTPTRKLVTFTPLDTSELPTDGEVVGIDAEFVTLNQVQFYTIVRNI